MDKTKVVCYKNRPAVIIGRSRPEQPTFVATVVYFIEEDGTLKPCIETTYDRTQITDYYCPHANDPVFPVIHCSDEGKCMYSATPGSLSSMCLTCKAESIARAIT